MALHGSLGPFDANLENWSAYVERLTHYFVANNVVDADKKRAILLAVCGPTTYKLIRSLVPAEAIPTTSFADLVEKVKEHLEPKPSAIVQRYKFNSRSRAQGETVATYLVALRELAQHCEYGETLQEMLRDRLVCGVNHEGTQRRLLAIKKLTYEKAREVALAVEAVEQGTRDLKQSSSPPLTDPLSPNPCYYTAVGTKTGIAKGRPSGDGKMSCYLCGGSNHLAPTCRFKEAVSRFCNKKGHLARVCRAKGRSDSRNDEPPKTHYVSEDKEDGSYCLFTLNTPHPIEDPLTTTLWLNEVPVSMEIDTGAAVSVINHSTYLAVSQQGLAPQLQNSDVRFKTYTGESIKVLGAVLVAVKYREKETGQLIQVVDGEGPNLMGRDLLTSLEVTWEGRIANISEHSQALKDVLDKHASVFTEELGCLQGQKVHLHINTTVTPKFCKPRTVPFALRDKVEAELDRLGSLGIISPVKSATWAAPIVPVVKKNGTVHICGDYKATINQATKKETYPLPRVEDLFANFSGGKYFTKLDLANAYLQLPLDLESSELVVINTHKGLFKYNRLPFGVSSAPAIFQRCMESLFHGQKGVSVFIDDILVTGSSTEEYLENLERVLHILESANLRLNKNKCSFARPSVEYLGYVIDEQGLHPTEEKVVAIRDAPKPRNVSELRAFLGIINYYSKFLPNLSTRLSPLYKLLQKKVR